MSLWTATCHSQVETQRQRDLERVDASSCVLRQTDANFVRVTRKKVQSNAKLGSGKRLSVKSQFNKQVTVQYTSSSVKKQFSKKGCAK